MPLAGKLSEAQTLRCCQFGMRIGQSSSTVGTHQPSARPIAAHWYGFSRQIAAFPSHFGTALADDPQ